MDRPREPTLDDLAALKQLAMINGYRFEVDADGTERMIRPDGSVALTARPRRSVHADGSGR